MNDVIWSGGVVCDDFLCFSWFLFGGNVFICNFASRMGVVPINLNKDVVRYHYK